MSRPSRPLAKPEARPLRRIVGPVEVQQWLRVSKATLDRWISKGYFPQPMRMGGTKTRRWFEDEVLAAIEKLRQGGSEKTA